MDIDERLGLIGFLRGQLAPVEASHEAAWIVDWIQDRQLQTQSERLRAAEEVVSRRLRHEPLAYIMGSWSFRSHEFFVGPGALIPRPETEELVEGAIQSVENSPQSLTRLLERGLRVGDLGAGTGCIGLSFMMDVFTDLDDYKGGAKDAAALSRLVLVEREAEARVWLEKNVEFHRPKLQGAKVEIFSGSWLDWHETGFDVILSNPPYIHESEFLTLDASVKDFEPRSSLVHGADGDGAYKEILEIARRALVSGGWLIMELGVAQGEWIQDYAAQLGGFNVLQVVKDMAKKPRFFCARLA